MMLQTTPTEPGASSSRANPYLQPLILALFFTFRLLSLVLFRPGGYFGDFSDFIYYREFAALSLNGYYPFVHYWMEYPPILPWLAVLLYQLTLGLPNFGQPEMWFQLSLGLLLAVADTLSLWLIIRIGRRLGGEAGALRSAVCYAGFFYPVHALTTGFDGLAMLFLLAMLDRLLVRSPAMAGVWCAVGALTKVFPVLAIPVALRFLPTWRDRLMLVGGASIIGGLIVAPLVVLSPTMALASATGLLARGSWQSIWAILDGYYGPGLVAALPDRLFYPDSATWSHPQQSGLLWLGTTVPIVLIALVFVGRTARTEPGLVRGAALLVTIFLLTSKGFSPQYTLWLLPFVALLMPSVRGVLWATAFTANNLFVEAYLYFHLFPTHRWVLWATVGTRMMLLVVFAIDVAAPLIAPLKTRWPTFKRLATAPAIGLTAIAVLLAASRLAPVYAEATLQNGLTAGQRAAVNTIGREASSDAVALFVRPSLLEALSPHLGGREPRLLADPKLRERQGEFSARALLRQYTAERAQVVLVSEPAQDDQGRAEMVRTLLALQWKRSGDWSAEGVRVERFDAALDPKDAGELKPLDVSFGDLLVLEGYARRGTARPGETIEVFLNWRGSTQMDRDYTVFIHVLDRNEQVVAQDDAMPGRNLAPTSGWMPDDEIHDIIGINLPEALPAGEYLLELGVYYVPTGERLPIVRNGEGDRLVLETVRIEK